MNIYSNRLDATTNNLITKQGNNIMTIKYSNVRVNHLATAKLIVDSVCFDTLAEYYILEDGMQFRTLCKMLEDIAKKETPHNFGFAKCGVTGVKEWLMGLPSVITVPFSYYDIYQWGYANDLLKDTDSDKINSRFSEGYWHKVALIINQYSVKCRRDIVSLL